MGRVQIPERGGAWVKQTLPTDLNTAPLIYVEYGSTYQDCLFEQTALTPAYTKIELAIGSGGTGQGTRQEAMDALAGYAPLLR